MSTSNPNVPLAIDPTTAAVQQVLGTSYAEYVAQQILAEPVGTISQIHNSLTSSELNVTIVQDPVEIEAQKVLLANQLNDQSAGPIFEDLSERIADVQIETVAQGADTLTIKVIDPTLALLDTPDKHGNTFIQKDQTGRLTPIILSWPKGTNCQWQLCQVDATYDPSNPITTLTFEDRIVSDLRNINAKEGGVAQGAVGQTLAGFIQSLVSGANRYYTKHPEVAGPEYTIKLVQLVSPKDPNYIPPAVASTGSTTVLHPQHRQNLQAKQQTGLTKAQRDYMATYGQELANRARVTSFAQEEAARTP